MISRTCGIAAVFGEHEQVAAEPGESRQRPKRQRIHQVGIPAGRGKQFKPVNDRPAVGVPGARLAWPRAGKHDAIARMSHDVIDDDALNFSEKNSQ